MKLEQIGRVLVVEDDKQLGDLYLIALETSGYQVDLAIDGVHALSMYAQALDGGHPYALVIMDMNLPEKNGQETLDDLLLIDSRAKVIVATGSVLEPTLTRELNSKVAGLLFKPFSLSVLSSEVAKAIC
jgi:two-component system, cell cycle sensor histidine kinase and response regulator CckA